jgi:hypothetical protein
LQLPSGCQSQWCVGMAQMLSAISRVLQEIFPLFFYWRNINKMRRLIGAEDLLQQKFSYAAYVSLSSDILLERLEEERARATALDEKTFKMTLSLGVGLTVVSTVYAVLIATAGSSWVARALGISVWLAVFYIFSAGFLALGALRTQPSFGYGTEIRKSAIARNKTLYADALIRQELSNDMRHLRNEASYQLLRNGLVLLFLSLTAFAVIKTFFSPAVNPGFYFGSPG